MMTLKSVKKRRQQFNARDVRGLGKFCFYPLEDKIGNTSCFPSIFGEQTVFTPVSKHSGLPGIYFRSMAKI